MRRLTIAPLIAVLAFLWVPAANADSLVFRDKDSDVAVARPDGSLVKKVTHASNPDNGYKAVSVADDGGITAFLNQRDDSGNSTFVVLNQDGVVLHGPYLFERYGICGGLSPFRTATSPDGTFVAVVYMKGSNNCLGGTSVLSTRIINRNAPTIGTSTYPSYDYLTEPHWTRHPDVRLAGINGGTVSVWQNDATKMDSWLALPVGSPYQFGGFDFHPTETKVLIDFGPANGIGVQPHRLELYTYTQFSTGANPPTSPEPQLVCALDAYVSNEGGGGRPFWSPDGSQIAWTGPEGIYVSPAPVANGDTCVLQPRLVVPGGSDVHWAKFAVTTPAGSGATGSGSGATTPTTPAKPKTPPALALAKALPAKKAFVLSLTFRRPALVSVTVTRKGAKKPLGTVSYIVKKKGIDNRRITKVRGKALKRGVYRVVVKVGAAKKALMVSVR